MTKRQAISFIRPRSIERREQTNTMTLTLGAISLKGIGALLGCAVNVLLARSLGADGVGVFFLTLTITTVACIVGRFGLDIALLRYLSPCVKEENWDRVNAFYLVGLKIIIQTSLAATILVILAAPLFATYVFSKPELTRPLQMMALAIPAISLVQVYAELLKALRHIYQALLIQSVILHFLVVLVLIPFARVGQVYGAVAAYIVAYSLVLFLSIHLWRTATPVLPARRATPIQSVRKDLFLKTGINLFFVAILNVIVDAIDTVMLGIYMAPADVGLYGVALRITALSSLLLVALNSVVAPEFASLWAQRDQGRLQELARRTTLWMLVVAALILLCLLTLASPILGLFGPQFAMADQTLRILAFGQFLVLGTGPVAYLLMMTGHERFHRNNLIFSAILTVVLNIKFIPLYGIEGAAYATTISLAAKNLLGVLYVRRKLGIKVLL